MPLSCTGWDPRLRGRATRRVRTHLHRQTPAKAATGAGRWVLEGQAGAPSRRQEGGQGRASSALSSPSHHALRIILSLIHHHVHLRLSVTREGLSRQKLLFKLGLKKQTKVYSVTKSWKRCAHLCLLCNIVRCLILFSCSKPCPRCCLVVPHMQRLRESSCPGALSLAAG